MVREFINKHEKLRYLDLCVRCVNNEQFRRRVLGGGTVSHFFWKGIRHVKKTESCIASGLGVRGMVFLRSTGGF